MSLQTEWQYFMRTVLGVGEYMGLVEEDLANKFLPKLMGLERILEILRNLLALGAKREGLGILNLA